MPIPIVPSERFIAAFVEFDRDVRTQAGWTHWESDPNHKYAIRHEGRRYPVKQLIAMATGADKDSFKGGDEANSYLDRLGFEVISLRDEVQYWKISPGERAKFWDECRDGGYISIGWGGLGDVSGLTQAQFNARVEAIQAEHPDWEYTKQGCQQVFAFSRIKPGHIIVANRGQKEVLGIGRVTGAYYYLPDIDHGHRLPVDWFDLTPRQVQETSWLSTLIELTPQRYQGIVNPAQTTGEAEAMTIPAFTHAHEDLYRFFRERRGLWFSKEILTNYALALKTKPFVILTGISGTGKTKIAQVFAEFMCLDEEQTNPILPAITENSFTVRPDPLIKYSYMNVKQDIQELLDVPAKGSSVSLKVTTPDSTVHDVTLTNIGFNNPDASTQVRLFIKKELKAWIKQHASDGTLVHFEKAPGGFSLSLVSGQKALVQGDRYAFVSVRPDWTDNRGLLGYYNPLTEKYVPTEVLRLMLRAAEDPDRPYFVILDEMNLAKVEHYFSDFLSCLESRRLVGDRIEQEGIILHDQGEAIPLEDEDGRIFMIPRKMPIPLNLYFTGTVNIDETTYMFSPKVLDRANTIEFNHVDLDRYGGSEDSEEQDSRFKLAAPLELGKPRIPTKVSYEQLPATARSVLAEVNRILTPYNLHFGYRVANEIAQYLQEASLLVGPSQADTALDLQILQKVLPKLHGSRAKLEKPLQHLLAYLVTRKPMRPDEATAWYRVNEASLELNGDQHLLLRASAVTDDVPQGEGGTATMVVPAAATAQLAAFPRAAAKVRRMLGALKEQGYASFVV